MPSASSKAGRLSEQAPDAQTAAIQSLAGRWMEHRLHATIDKVNAMFKEYRLSEALMTLYKLIWDDFCSWYLEMIKPAYGEPIDRATVEQATALYEQMTALLHPFMPFVTEEIWHQLRARLEGEDCIVSSLPKGGAYDEDFLQLIEEAKELVTAIREVRNNYGIKMKDPLKVFVQDSRSATGLFQTTGLKEMISKMAVLESFEITETDIESAVAFLAGKDKFFAVVEKGLDKDEECARLRKEQEHYRGFIASVQAKLSNERFVGSAPEVVVAKERQKLADGEAKLRVIEESLAQLGC
jgi:valyl-tRNA synthetase